MKNTFSDLKTLAISTSAAVAAVTVLMFSPLSPSSAAALSLDVLTTSSKDSALYTGEKINLSLQIRNSGTAAASIISIKSTSSELTTACQVLIGSNLQPGESLSCSKDGVVVSGLPSSNFVLRTVVESAGTNQVKAAFESTSLIELWWYGRIPGYWKNHIDEWTIGFLPTDYLEDVFLVPNTLLTNGILDNDSFPGRDTLLSTLTYQGGTTLKGAGQILLRAASAALLNEAYYKGNYPGANSLPGLIKRVNVVLASESKVQYLVLAGFFESWNSGVRTPLGK